MRKSIVAVLADHASAHALRAQGLSWAEVFERFAGNPGLTLTPAEAVAWHENGFGEWAGRGRLLITARLETFAKLKGLSAKVGDYVLANRREEWVGLFLRDQFVKRVSF